MALVACRECGQKISTEAKVCPHCGVQHPTGKPSNNAGKGCLTVIIIIVLIVIIGAISDSMPAPPTNSTATAAALTGPQDISNSDNANIVKVARTGDDILVTLNMPQNITLNMQVEQTARDIFQLAKKQTLHGESFDQLTFVAQDEVVDPYGNQSIAPVFQVEFISDSLKKVNWDNLSDVGLLNLEWNTNVLGRAGQQLLQAYCNNEGSEATSFCEGAEIVVNGTSQ